MEENQDGVLKAINSAYEGLKDILDIEYKELYQNISSKKLQDIFSTLHAQFIACFEAMNQELSSAVHNRRYLAKDSRALLQAIKISKKA